MKRLLVLAVASMMLCLCACGSPSTSSSSSDASSSSSEATAASSDILFATLGDALSVDSAVDQARWDDERYIYVFESDGTPYRVVGEMTPEIAEKLGAIETQSDNYKQQVFDVLKNQKVISVEDLSLGIPDQATLDKLIGKTGQELIDDGYELMGYYAGDENAIADFDKGLYEYNVNFNEKPKDPGDFDGEKEVPAMTVKSIEYSGLSYNATDLSYTV